ncbi:serine hydrolase [Roseateles sp. DAIF2]|uniref:serine hydrolase domain-containing protein n=1 Tax=Roseateles sp. DAIF2 TaxID=2714952 RepID=UPI0018A2EEC5|nr:serine hydrolase domain-containing protein [Roseateles sp. DAIF2]QPF72366.1 serine hydrolase [Roseateles sp. DAIF2]
MGGTNNTALDTLFQPFDRHDAPGLVVGIAHRGRLLYRRGFGMASLEHAVANTPATRMPIGSSSKHFTSLAILLLAEEGLLEIDAGVRRYLPELPAPRGEPTLRQLMSHTGGQRCYLDAGFLADGMGIKPAGAAMALMRRQTDANFAPGEKMIYSNGGYHQLSQIIARVSGMSYEAFLKARLFDPLGMADTASVRSDFEIHPGMATLHVPVPPELGGGWRRGIFPSEEASGDGATVTTVDDMLRWLAHLRSPHKIVGSARSWDQLLSPAALGNRLRLPYALGLMRHDYRGVELIHHAGGVVGGSCQILTAPAHALDIVIMANGVQASPVQLAYQVVDLVLGDALRPPPPKADAARFRAMLGTRYHAPDSGLVIGFAEGGDGTLGLSFLNGPPLSLRDEGEALRLRIQDLAIGPLEMPSQALAGEPPDTLLFSEGGHAERAQRLPSPPPSLAEAGSALVGRYLAPDLDAEATMAFEGERLLLRVAGHYGTTSMTLDAYASDVFGWQMEDPFLPLRGTLNVQREAGRVIGFQLDTWRTRGLRFDRAIG